MNQELPTQPRERGRARILFCRCAYANAVPADVKRDVETGLQEHPDVVFVEDLCGMAARKDARLLELAGESTLTVVACYPRVVKWLFEAAGHPFPEDGATRVLNMRTQNAAAILEQLGPGASGEVAAPFRETLGESPDWVPWFPVIDYERCKNCMQCRDFCLFGVYALDEAGRVTVANPASCKNNCPACARICPAAAIMFPKYDESPINGDVIADEEEQQARIKVDVDRILGSDIYATLAERQRKARKKLLDRRQIEQALRERDACKQCEAEDGTRPCS